MPVDPDLPAHDPDRPGRGERVRRRRRITAVAASQAGLFTVAQAAEAGLDRRARHHHLSYGNWRRSVAPGVLRLVGWPSDPDEWFRAWLLWAGPGAALTGWNALELLGLGRADRTVPVLIEARRPARARTARRHEYADSVGRGSGRVLWRRAPSRPSNLVVRGLAVRPAAQSLAAAVSTTPTADVPRALELVDELAECDALDPVDLWLASDCAAVLRAHLERRIFPDGRYDHAWGRAARRQEPRW